MARKVAKQLGERGPPSLIVLPPTPVPVQPQVRAPVKPEKAVPPVPPLPVSVPSRRVAIRADATQPGYKIVWEGEWNRDRQDVLHNLRMLKAVR